MTMLPLPPSKAGSSAPGERKAPDFGASPNRGLIYNKFVDKWPPNAALEEFQGLGEQKKEWVKNFTGGTGDGKELEKAAKRVCDLAKILCRSDDPPPMIFHTKSPFPHWYGVVASDRKRVFVAPHTGGALSAGLVN